MEDTLEDVYDGKVWKDYQYLNSTPFLASPHNLGLMMNVDWFNPYKHSPYSLGAIYLVVLNLPRSERFKIENLLLIGIIPGPSEPPLNINTYLEPLVDELNQLFVEGMYIQSRSQTVLLKAALLLVSCDIPAVRKVCGFLGHAAKLGCSKCLKSFHHSGGFGSRMLYSGFEDCPLRTEAVHRQQAQLTLDQNTATSRKNAESATGSRYTALMELHYFDCVRFHVVDPMHNLFLGTAKHMIKNVWMKDLNGTTLLLERDLVAIQERVDHCNVPSFLGRIPRKIASKFVSFKADQWKSWTLIFSVYALYGFLDNVHLECWRKFVRACRLLSSTIITSQQIQEAHHLLVDFCKNVEMLYGTEVVTINMHLHTHLKESILDFGPISSFWVFAFERFNGYLGKFPTNNRSVEIQLMRKFTRDLHFRNLSMSRWSFGEIPSFDFTQNTCTGTLKEMVVDHNEFSIQLSLLPVITIQEVDQNLWSYEHHVHFLGAGKRILLDDHQVDHLLKVYKILYPGLNFGKENTNRFVTQYGRLESRGQIWGSQNSSSKSSSFIVAAWYGQGGQIATEQVDLRPGLVLHYFKHYVYIGAATTQVPHLFAQAEWFSPHPEKQLFGYPIEVWCRNVYEQSGPASILPFNRIYSQFVGGSYTHNDERVLCVCPTMSQHFL